MLATMIDTMDTVYATYRDMPDEQMSEFYNHIGMAAWTSSYTTKNMKPKAGRASYVNQVRYLVDTNAGAYAAALWIATIAHTIAQYKDAY
jgi:hypothetical protein